MQLGFSSFLLVPSLWPAVQVIQIEVCSADHAWVAAAQLEMVWALL